MQLKERTYEALVKIINGEEVNIISKGCSVSLLPYKSGSDLVSFFNELGSNDVYNGFFGSQFGSRRSYTDEKLRALQSVQEFSNLINLLLHPINNIGRNQDYNAVVEYLNPYLRHENMEIYSYQGRHDIEYAVKSLSGNIVDFDLKEKSCHPLTHQYIDEHIQKCDKKLASGDYSGAITNARTLIEEVLKAIQSKLDAEPKEIVRDLPRLYKEVQRLLSLNPASYPEGPLKQLLSGLVSIVGGISAIRNQSGDAHATLFKPKAHHASLAVNAAKTLVNFLFETFEHQSSSGKIVSIDEHPKEPIKA